MKKAKKLHFSEFETNNLNLFECLLFVKNFADNNSTVTDAYVEKGNYIVHFKDAHPYFDGLVKPTLTSMTYCEPYMHLEQVEVAKNHIKVPLKNFKNQNNGR